jgi:peptidoglycan/xylan/chitin deacetylase (PgdA/CDA1 family)
MTLGIAAIRTGWSRQGMHSDVDEAAQVSMGSSPQDHKVWFHAPDTRRIALTIDDGFDPATVAAYVKLCQTSGLHLTFNPVGILAPTWERHARALRPLIERGQVQIGNHTYHHHVLTDMSDAQIRSELERNEEWIHRTFGVSSRPYLRPPGGLHDERVDSIAAEVGFSRVLLWQGSFGDSVRITPEELLAAAQGALHPGAVVLGHANFPTVTHVYPELLQMLTDRKLQASTLDELFGTTH